jgi:hypothetical protein
MHITHIPPTHARHVHKTGNKPLTSPKTNLQIDEGGAQLFPNVVVRGLMVEYKEAETREWAEAERRWREWAEGQQEQQEQHEQG